MHVCIIGAGVIGVTAAWELAQAGIEVTLLDAAATPGSVTSFANGGQLSYNYVAPLATPGVWRDLPGWLLRRDSPLRFRPQFERSQWRWLFQFLRAANTRDAARTTSQLLTLSKLSEACLQPFLADESLAFAHQRNGKLIVYRSPQKLAHARAQVAYQARLGSEQQILDAKACVQLEPALAPVEQAIAGAVYTPGEAAGDCARFTRGLYQRLVQLPGVTALLNHRVRGFAQAHGQIRQILLHDAEPIAVDQVVMAAGMGSSRLLAQLGVRSPLYPLRGYSLSVPLQPDMCVPQVSVTDYERRTVYAHLGDQLRIAAMIGIGVRAPDPRRIALLRRQVSELLPHVDTSTADVWSGERPATASGKPVIGRSSRIGNLWYNLGQGALGFTLACGSARLLAELMQQTSPAVDARPFAPALLRL